MGNCGGTNDTDSIVGNVWQRDILSKLPLDVNLTVPPWEDSHRSAFFQGPTSPSAYLAETSLSPIPMPSRSPHIVKKIRRKGKVGRWHYSYRHRRSGLTSGQYRQKVLEDVLQPMHFIAPFSLSIISKIIFKALCFPN